MPEDTGTPEDLGTQTPPEGDVPAGQPADDSQESTTAVDWESRYNDLRPHADRAVAQLTQYEQFINQIRDPETQAEALQALGLELSQEEEAELEEDDFEFRDPRVDELLARDQQAQVAADEAELEDIEWSIREEQIAGLQQANGQEFTDQELMTLIGLADANRNEQGLLDSDSFAAAFDQFTQSADAYHKRYVASKRAAQLGAGTAGQETVDLSSPDARHKVGMEVAAAALEDGGLS